MVYKVAIIGAGIISRSHLLAISSMPQLRAVGIADIQEARAQESAEEFGTRAYSDYKSMVEQEKPDLVVITLPHFLHKEAAVWCAERGCHLMLEKPMALTVDECDTISNAADAYGVKLMVGHTQHYFADNLKAREIIRERVLGDLVMIQEVRHLNYFDDKRPEWFFYNEKAGGGIFMNLGSHSIDKIQFLTDSRIAKVKASVSHYGNKGNIEGSGIAFVETSSGITATICQSGYSGVNRNDTELIFTNGMMKLSTGSSGLWVSEQRAYKQLDVEQTELPFVMQFNDLIDSIENGHELACSGDYGRSVIHAVISMYESSRLGTEIKL